MRHVVALPIRGVVEPAAHHETQEVWLPLEAQRGIKLFGVVGLKSNVLARHGLQEMTDHRGRDATPANSGLSPDIQEIRVANAVGKHTGYADQPAVQPSECDVLRVLEGRS